MTLFIDPPCWSASEAYDDSVPLDLTDTVCCFFNKARDPLSLEYEFPFYFKGSYFPNVALAYHCLKASAWKQHSQANFMYEDAQTGDEARLMAESLEATTEQRRLWARNKVSIMKELLDAKYKQCKWFRQALEPGYRYIHVSDCLLWGTGCSAGDINFEHNSCATPVYPGENVLGRLLTQLAVCQTLTKTGTHDATCTRCDPANAVADDEPNANTWQCTFKPEDCFTGAVPDPFVCTSIHPFKGYEHPLSNFFPFTFHFKGTLFKSSEHAYQYAKAQCFNDQNIAFEIRYDSLTAFHAKRAANKMNPTRHQVLTWASHKIAVMKEILEAKNLQCPQFRALLSPSIFYVETTRDVFWGCGLQKEEFTPTIPHFKVSQPTYPGRNVLGLILTRLAQTGTLTGNMVPINPRPATSPLAAAPIQYSPWLSPREQSGLASRWTQQAGPLPLQRSTPPSRHGANTGAPQSSLPRGGKPAE